MWKLIGPNMSKSQSWVKQGRNARGDLKVAEEWGKFGWNRSRGMDGGGRGGGEAGIVYFSSVCPKWVGGWEQAALSPYSPRWSVQCQSDNIRQTLYTKSLLLTPILTFTGASDKDPPSYRVQSVGEHSVLINQEALSRFKLPEASSLPSLWIYFAQEDLEYLYSHTGLCEEEVQVGIPSQDINLVSWINLNLYWKADFHLWSHSNLPFCPTSAKLSDSAIPSPWMQKLEKSLIWPAAHSKSSQSEIEISRTSITV